MFRQEDVFLHNANWAHISLVAQVHYAFAFHETSMKTFRTESISTSPQSEAIVGNVSPLFRTFSQTILPVEKDCYALSLGRVYSI